MAFVPEAWRAEPIACAEAETGVVKAKARVERMLLGQEGVS